MNNILQYNRIHVRKMYKRILNDRKQKKKREKNKYIYSLKISLFLDLEELFPLTIS